MSRVYRQRKWGRLQELLALREVDLTLQQQETLALVGESGGGKTTLARILLGLLQASAGEVWYGGLKEPTRLPFASSRHWRRYRARVQLVSQDPEAALDPEMTVGASIEEGYQVQHPELPRSRRRQLVGHLMEELGLRRQFLSRMPGALSGGEKRRVIVARAFAALGYGCPQDSHPRILVADEPTAGLDAVVRSQVLRFFETQRQTMGISYLLISHDLDIVEKIADRVAIMYAGQIVEIGGAANVLGNPQHPYTRQLLLSRRLDQEATSLSEGDRERRSGRGCSFLAGCRDPLKDKRCDEPPSLIGSDSHRARCWFGSIPLSDLEP